MRLRMTSKRNQILLGGCHSQPHIRQGRQDTSPLNILWRSSPRNRPSSGRRIPILSLSVCSYAILIPWCKSPHSWEPHSYWPCDLIFHQSTGVSVRRHQLVPTSSQLWCWPSVFMYFHQGILLNTDDDPISRCCAPPPQNSSFLVNGPSIEPRVMHAFFVVL